MFEMQVGQKDFSDADENTLFEPSEVELREVMHRLLVEIDRVKAKRVVFDSLSELRLLAQHPLRCRKKTTGRSQAGDAGSGGYSPIRAGTRR
jgi:circadian clock protein KaiC